MIVQMLSIFSFATKGKPLKAAPHAPSITTRAARGCAWSDKMVLSISSAALRCASASMRNPSSCSTSVLLLYDTINGIEIHPPLWRPGPFGLTPYLFRRNRADVTRQKESRKPRMYQSGITKKDARKRRDEGAGAETDGRGERTNVL